MEDDEDAPPELIKEVDKVCAIAKGQQSCIR